MSIPKNDFVITCGYSGHGISGHLREVLDYYIYFKEYFNSVQLCLFPEDIQNVRSIIETQYTINEEFFNILETPKILYGKYVFFVDGHSNDLFLSPSKNAFRCVNETELNYFTNVFQDSRIYEDLPNSIHYVKKINFDYYKEIKKSKHRTLLYLTSNCRMISEQEILRIRKKYPGMRFLIISDVDKPYFHFDNAEFRYVPVDNLFEEFDTYMYTEVKDACHGDCSPRFIAECKFYGKEVIYENLTSSPGLEIRKYDIEHNFEKLFLTKNDPLADYIFK